MKNPILKNAGSLEIITGCMFSGKTQTLINHIKRAKSQGQITKVFKPSVDIRYHPTHLSTHDGQQLEAIAILNPHEIFNHVENATLIGIDEVQFFDETIIETCKKLINLKIDLIIAGLEIDFRGKPLGYITNLLAFANTVTKLSAICKCCGNEAYHTFKKTNSEVIIEIGEKELYEARCFECYQKGVKIFSKS